MDFTESFISEVWQCSLSLECPTKAPVLKVWFLGKCYGHMGPSGRPLGYFSCAPEGDNGPVPLSSSLLFPGHEVYGFSLSWTPHHVALPHHRHKSKLTN